MFAADLVRHVLSPLCSALPAFATHLPRGLDPSDTHAFVLQASPSPGDTSSSLIGYGEPAKGNTGCSTPLHVDESVVTATICLSLPPAGGGQTLLHPPGATEPVSFQHSVGCCLIHAGSLPHSVPCSPPGRAMLVVYCVPPRHPSRPPAALRGGTGLLTLPLRFYERYEFYLSLREQKQECVCPRLATAPCNNDKAHLPGGWACLSKLSMWLSETMSAQATTAEARSALQCHSSQPPCCGSAIRFAHLHLRVPSCSSHPLRPATGQVTPSLGTIQQCRAWSICPWRHCVWWWRGCRWQTPPGPSLYQLPGGRRAS